MHLDLRTNSCRDSAHVGESSSILRTQKDDVQSHRFEALNLIECLMKYCTSPTRIRSVSIACTWPKGHYNRT